MEDKAARIELINQEIVKLMLQRRKLARLNNNWAEEDKVYKQIEELEKQIKQIRAE